MSAEEIHVSSAADSRTFELAERIMRTELRRFDLRHQERILTEVILQLSLGWGRRSVKIPTLDYFYQITGIKVPHVSTALKALREMGIVITGKCPEGEEYRIELNPGKWRVRVNVPRIQLGIALEALKPLNGFSEWQAESERAAMKALADVAMQERSAKPNFNEFSRADFLAGHVTD